MLKSFSCLELGQKWIYSDGGIKKMHTRFSILMQLEIQIKGHPKLFLNIFKPYFPLTSSSVAAELFWMKL